jgi:hypothetical protein
MSSKPLFRLAVLTAALAASVSALAADYYVVVPLPARTDTGAADISVGLSAFNPPAGLVGDVYPGFDFNQVLQVTGDQAFNANNVRWYVAGGALPAGLSLSSSGKLSGTPTAAGSSSFVIKALYRTKSGTNTYQVSVTNLQVSLGSAALPNATQGATYSYDMKPRLSVSGDPGYSPASVTWSLASGALPAGLSLGSDGVITGVATAEGTYPFTVRAAYRTRSGAQSYQVVVGAITVGLQSATLPDAMQGTAYSYDLKTLLSISGDAAYSTGTGVSWSVTSGALPAGLSLGANGVITGSATAEGTFPFTVQAVYKSKSGTQAYQVVVGAITVSLAQATPPGGIVGIAYNNGTGFDLKPSVSVSGDGAYAGSGAGVQWKVLSGNLPAGLSLSLTGVITGTPTTAATSATVQVQASYKGKAATQSYSLPITGSIQQFSGYRAFADGTYAATCNGYRNPGAPHYYQGATGDGIYRITPGGSPYDVYCDMTTNGGGYTVIEASRDYTATGATFVQAPAGSPPVPGEANGSYLPSTVAIALANLSSEVRIAEYGSSNAIWSTSATMLNNLRQGYVANYNTLAAYDPTSLWSFSSSSGFTQLNTTESIYGLTGSTYPSIYWSGGNSNGLHVTGGSGGASNAAWKYQKPNGPMYVMYR